jgi:hypothetical protein
MRALEERSAETADPLEWIGGLGAGAVVAATVPEIARKLEQVGPSSDEQLARQRRHATQLVDEEFSWPPMARILVDAYARYAGDRIRAWADT